MSENMNDKFFKGFDEMLEKCSVEELARMAIDAGFIQEGVTIPMFWLTVNGWYFSGFNSDGAPTFLGYALDGRVVKFDTHAEADSVRNSHEKLLNAHIVAC